MVPTVPITLFEFFESRYSSVSFNANVVFSLRHSVSAKCLKPGFLNGSFSSHISLKWRYFQEAAEVAFMAIRFFF